MGRLTRDPELRYTQNSTPVTSFTLAVDRGGRRSSDPNAQTADFIDIVAWSSTAEFVCKWFRKGLLVAVVGRIQTRKWTDNEGRTRTAFEVVADEVHFAEPKRESTPAGGYGSGAFASPAKAAPQAGAPAPDDGFSDITAEDDELPF
jgi:single-strand DNA-binding protein